MKDHIFLRINIFIAEQSCATQQEIVEKLRTADFSVNQEIDPEKPDAVVTLSRGSVNIAMTAYLPYAETILAQNKPSFLFADWNLNGPKPELTYRFVGAILAEEALLSGFVIELLLLWAHGSLYDA